MGQDDFFAHAAQSAGLDPGDTRIEMVRQPTGLEALLGMERALGTAPAAQQGAGVHPVLSASICGRGQPLAYAGDLSAVCG